jgi:AraC-like DNA-binding protein
MRIPLEILLLTSGAGALQSAFFSIYLFSIRKGRTLANILLALLLLAFTVRIFKSMVYYFSDGHQVPNMIMNFGFGANLAIFPLLLLYLNSFFNPQYRYDWLKHSFHFIPALVAIVFSGIIPPRFWMQQDAYAISLWSGVLYLPFCIYAIWRNFRSVGSTQKMWVISLTVGITVVWMGYLTNFIFGLVSYITAPVSFSVLMYVLSYIGLRRTDIFMPKERYQNSAYTDHQIGKCFEGLLTLLENDPVYKDPAVTLPKVADLLSVTPNLLSETINKRNKQSFPDYINSLRIRDARVLLSDAANNNLKIAAIAYETGFNSISVFNAAFKKHSGVTPSAYRKQFPGNTD